MKNFKQIIEEVNFTLNVIMLFDIILSSLIIFLLSYLTINLFGFNGLWGGIPAFMYFVWETSKVFHINKLRMVEDRYQNLSEKLRTAKDYLASDNPFVEELQDEIKDEIKDVQAAQFFNEKRTYIKAGSIVLICVSILILAPFNIVLFDFGEAVSGIIDRERIEIGSVTPRDNRQDYDLISVDEEWYGDFSLGELGDDQMQVQLIEANYKLVSNVVEEVKDKEFDDMYPGAVDVRRAGLNDVRIEEENQEIVKNYFREISK